MAPEIIRKEGIVSMCWNDNQRHSVPKGVTLQEFVKHHTKYYAYYVVHDDKVLHFHMGSGRPFATCCMGCRRELGDNPINITVGIPEDLKPGNTPVLGWCACVTCLACVYSMPLEHGLWRRCRGCWHPFAHQHTYHMYPVTLAGIEANNEKAQSMQ
jgi:hypothetical protein